MTTSIKAMISNQIIGQTNSKIHSLNSRTLRFLSGYLDTQESLSTHLTLKIFPSCCLFCTSIKLTLLRFQLIDGVKNFGTTLCLPLPSRQKMPLARSDVRTDRNYRKTSPNKSYFAYSVLCQLQRQLLLPLDRSYNHPHRKRQLIC